MPAAAVIPAPIAYIEVVAVKKLVVGCVLDVVSHREYTTTESFGNLCMWALSCVMCGGPSFTVKKLECLKQGVCL